MSSNGLGNKTSYFMPVCSIVRLLPLGAVGDSFDYTTNRHEITV